MANQIGSREGNKSDCFKMMLTIRSSLHVKEQKMKKISLVFLSILLVACFGELNGQKNKIDQCGKLACQIVDPVSGNPILEEFVVIIINIDRTEKIRIDPVKVEKGRDYPGLYTDKAGCFSAYLLAGRYEIFFIPHNEYSIYSIEPYNAAMKFRIDRGKITKIRRAAKYGGTIKAVLVDQNNNKINTSTTFFRDPEIIVEIGIENSELPRYTSYTLKSGEGTFPMLYPGKYTLKVTFGNGLGFNEIIKDFIIKEKDNIEFRIPINLTNVTIIEGYVYDESGKPAADAEVSIGLRIRSGGSYVKTNELGFYRMIGLDPGIYKLTVSFNKNLYFNWTDDGYYIVELKKNILIKKDLFLRKIK